MKIHHEQVLHQLHVACHEVADNAAKVALAATLVGDDIGYLVIQVDDGTVWQCVAAATLVFVGNNLSGEGYSVTGAGTVTIKLGDAAGVQDLILTDSADVSILNIDSDGHVTITPTIAATGVLTGITYTGVVNTNQTLSTEIPAVTITTAGREWATGAIATQREVLITQPTYTFVGASTITDAATVGIAGAPIKSANATLTRTHGLLIQAGAVGAADASYGLTVNTPTGATANYAAAFLGGYVGVGTIAPTGDLAVTQTITALGVLKGIVYTGAVNTNQTLSTEIPAVTITTAGREWATGALALQREVLVTQPTYSFVGASTITDAATIGIVGGPVEGANATITNAHGLLIQAGAVGAAGASYGLTVNAQTGAGANYTAQFMGGNVGVDVAAPVAKVDIAQLAAGGAIPVIKLNQVDDSEGYFDFIGNTAADATGPISSWTVAALTGYVRCEINGAAQWIAYYADPSA